MSEVSAQKAGSASSQSFLTALVTYGATLIVEVGAFIILKQRLKRVYAPRTYLPPPDKRSTDLPRGAWRWAWAVVWSPTQDIIHKNGLDAYMFLRFLRIMIWIFGVFTVATWVVLLPVDAANIPDSNETGLSRFQWGNITQSQSPRFAAHIILVYLLTFFVLFLIRREILHFIHTRQEFLISPSHSKLAQARTLLVTGVPDEMANEKSLKQWASFVPGGVNRVWIYRDNNGLNKLFSEREKACIRLEKASSKILRTATKTFRSSELKSEKQARAAAKQARKKAKQADVEMPPIPDPLPDGHLEKPEPNPDSFESFVPHSKRPKHRPGLPLVGKKVDTIDWCTAEIARLNQEIPERRVNLEKDGKPLGSAFIECNLQIGAHVLAQCVSYHEPLQMADKWIDVSTKDIIWDNIDDGAYETRARSVISWVLTIGLIILWFLPVAFIGLLSNISSLCAKVHWLSWICKAPTPVPGIIEGLVPPLLLAILFLLLPMILRAFAFYQCIPRYSLVSISVYKRYFIFIVIHGFLVVTITSGLTSVIPEAVSNPASTVADLAAQLPDSSIFFLTYMVAQGFAGAGGALLQIAPLIMHFIKKKFLGRTPRQAFDVTFLMPNADFGVILPRMSLLATIGIAYSVISPIINALAFASYLLLFLAWKFLLMYVFDQPDELETGGLYFPIVISNLFVGLYIEQICLAALFFLKSGTGLASLAQGILMVVLLVLTFSAQMLMKNACDPVSTYLPISLATKKLQEKFEKEQRQAYWGKEEKEEEIVDLFNRDHIKSVVRKRLKKLDDVTKKALPGSSNAHSTSVNPSHTVEPSTSTSAPTIVVPITDLENNIDEHSENTKDSHDSSHDSDHPVIAPAAPRVEDPNVDEDYDEELEEHAFEHPATYANARWIWIPQDTLGFSKVLLEQFKAAGVEASDVGSTMDEKGVVECSRNPPDEDWSGGFDK
ncbi:DUF221-domain-containing protein [Sistotremastrum niveocremeum HHB9708]|uniref:DUF221-domain-containing protein n=2 Tax=Sistotremastraceae TaxID=3402574 RepID=A0A164NM05_9AGAM|nr:DUF221-domain-containing protein [Sistotremastrum niveocremeum HHB9708]KZT33907.1 DUF221-domain-containing protein [Sistotremastrum suecicum HHB10207 ss-3]